ncbi:conserved protein of unknown function [Petrocella atlantisensis]|uniref:Uncharacterized protein n=1 Tax=Petrocella atlantisensis TaxID=2173034 RepID=A0A3P7S0F6_9FIRM|nr:plasmid pRiA4b ORF-3 family protein [Petrocella atlantisensis]VDN48366.1 conserved protein of unknown function [Petrocella atlantisensis]
MQIALTGKLAKALGMKPPAIDENIDPLFTWTANWAKVWENRRTEDLLVLVNNATRFTVAVYQVKRKDLNKIEEKIKNAIRNTLLAYNLNTEMVDVYLDLSGAIEYTKNSSRHASAWVTKAGLECSFHIGREYNGIDKMYSDVIGVASNYRIVNYSNNKGEGFYTYKAMIKAMEDLTGLQPYKSRAFELRITLDLEVYTAERKILVPANLSFTNMHKVIQKLFDWSNYHLYNFTVFNQLTGDKELSLVPFMEDLEYDSSAIIMKEHTLSDVFPKSKKMVYTYDFGDNWKHDIELVQVIEEYDGELPYLIEAKGQTPPEGVGGIGGFVEFREIMLDKDNPNYEETKNWSRLWTPELSEWKSRPRVIDVWW